jgi:hypothetical protein
LLYGCVNYKEGRAVAARLKVLNDFAFQKAFGEKGDEVQLLSFLNAALDRTGKGKLESVEIYRK